MLRGRSFALSAGVASVVKLAVLSLTAAYVVHLPGPLAAMMGLPQLYTALAGAGGAITCRTVAS
jgi:hypothetical protein